MVSLCIWEKKNNLKTAIIKNKTKIKIFIAGDFPGRPVVKNPLANAGDAGLIPGQGTKTPHTKEQLSSHTTAREKPVHRTEDPSCHSEDPDTTK